MKKQEFITELQEKLSGFPIQELNERINFYSEMIDDRIEEGCSEEEAVKAVGSINDIFQQIISEIPMTKLAKEKIKPKRRLKMWEIVILALGSPLWITLLISALAVMLSVYVSVWSIIISVWAVFFSFIVCGASCLAFGIIYAISVQPFEGFFAVAVGLILAGLGIFLFFGCKAITEGVITLTKKIALSIKKSIIQKEAVQ